MSPCAGAASPSSAPRSGQLSSLTVDDNGGMRDRDGRVEPGDDRDSDIYVAGFEGGHDDGWDDSGA